MAHWDRLEIHPLDGDDVAATTVDGPLHELAWTPAGLVTTRDFAAHVRDPGLADAPARLFDGTVWARELTATTQGTPLVVMPIPDGGLAMAIHGGHEWATQTLATPARAQALALTPDGSRLTALISDTPDSCELLLWELPDGEPISDWRVVGGFPGTWPDRLGGYPNPGPASSTSLMPWPTIGAGSSTPPPRSHACARRSGGKSAGRRPPGWCSASTWACATVHTAPGCRAWRQPAG